MIKNTSKTENQIVRLLNVCNDNNNNNNNNIYRTKIVYASKKILSESIVYSLCNMLCTNSVNKYGGKSRKVTNSNDAVILKNLKILSTVKPLLAGEYWFGVISSNPKKKNVYEKNKLLRYNRGRHQTVTVATFWHRIRCRIRNERLLETVFFSYFAFSPSVRIGQFSETVI